MAKNNSLSVNLDNPFSTDKPKGLKQIMRNIRFIASSTAKMNEFIHVTAMAILEHAKVHGDCTSAQDLMNAMPASYRRTKLRDWFSSFSPIVVKIDDPKWTGKMWKDGDKKYTPFDLEGADANPFYKLAEADPEEKVYTFAELMAMVTALSKRIAKKAENGEVSDNDLPSATALASALAALRVDAPAAANSDEPKEDKPKADDIVEGEFTEVSKDTQRDVTPETVEPGNVIAQAMLAATRKAA